MSTPIPELPDLVDSYGSMILGAAIGLLLLKGNDPDLIREQVDQVIKALTVARESPELIERLADVAISTAMDLLSDDK